MSLVLDSLEIKNFRAFKHLRIERLGRVNLIVGKNNVGKSSVLEALWLYAMKGEPALLYRLLIQRDEIILDEPLERKLAVNAHERALAISNLFFERQDTRQPHELIRIGSANDANESIEIDIEWPNLVQTRDGQPIEGLNGAYHVLPHPPMLNIHLGMYNSVGFSLSQEFRWAERVIPPDLADYINTFFVGPTGLSSTDMAVLWDVITLSDLEKEVIAALKIIAPQVVAINLIGNERLSGGRIPKARTIDSKVPIPLRSMGEGMSRMFGIALALVNAKDGMLLIDEVDTGLHYSVLPDVWKLIFEVAHRLNVQVFATTHSWDCIQAFQQAADENKEEEGVVIRLENREGEVAPVVFDERMLNIATREQIEVR